MRRNQLLGIVVGLLLFDGAAFAQIASSGASPAQGDSDSATLAEIVVTAQKRQQSVMDVGMSINAPTGAQLEQLGVTDLIGLEKAVPGFTVSTNFDGVPVFGIRGLVYDAVQLDATPTVSVYVDEAPLPYSAMTEGTMLDLERVEVLKGPQGTLFGNNSTAGAINFIAAKPTDVFSAGALASYSNWGQAYVEGFASGPLTDTLKARIAVSSTQGGAWQRTYTAGPELENGTADKGAERLIVEWEPQEHGPKISLNLNSYYDLSQPQALQLSLPKPEAGPPLIYPVPGPDDRAADFSNDPRFRASNNDHFYQAVLRGDIPLSSAIQLTSIANYAHLDYYMFRDPDGTRLLLEEGGQLGTLETVGDETRLSGDFANGLHFIVGGNYSHDIVHEQEPYYYLNTGFFPPNVEIDPPANSSTETKAAFANADWSFTNQLTLTAGVRYTDVHQAYASCNLDPGNGLDAALFGDYANLLRSAFGLGPTNTYMAGKCVTIGSPPTFLPSGFSASSTDHNVPWRVGVNYKPDPDLLLYALVSRGFKAGGYPFLSGVELSEYAKVKQEQVTDYELGVKGSAGRLFSVSAAVFYYDYLNKQLYTTEPSIIGPVISLDNMPKSKAYGFDGEVTFKPLSGLTFHGALTYSRTDITDPGPVTMDGAGNPINLVGHSFGYAPVWSANLDGLYRVPLNGQMDAFIGANASYRSQTYSDISEEAPFLIRSYTTVDARLGVDYSRFMVMGWVTNLTNQYYWTSVNYIAEGYERITGMPRTVGITASYKF
jgi:iron complex outermembrane receptor protein